MVRAALTVGLLTFSATPEARHLPPGLQAVRILEGSARLHMEGNAEPDAYPTLLPAGVFFNAAGYDALNIATQQLQANLQAVEGRLRDYERVALTPCPLIEPPRLEGRWSTGEVILAVAAGVLVGAGGFAVWQTARTP